MTGRIPRDVDPEHDFEFTDPLTGETVTATVLEQRPAGDGTVTIFRSGDFGRSPQES